MVASLTETIRALGNWGLWIITLAYVVTAIVPLLIVTFKERIRFSTILVWQMLWPTTMLALASVLSYPVLFERAPRPNPGVLFEFPLFQIIYIVGTATFLPYLLRRIRSGRVMVEVITPWLEGAIVVGFLSFFLFYGKAQILPSWSAIVLLNLVSFVGIFLVSLLRQTIGPRIEDKNEYVAATFNGTVQLFVRLIPLWIYVGWFRAMNPGS